MTSGRVFVVGGWRYEPAWLVKEFKANMAWADKVVIVDDRKRTNELWVNEGKYRIMQRQAMERAGIKEGDWVLVTSPDERWPVNAAAKIREFIAAHQGQKVIGAFPLREMWSLTHYRVDGMWGEKTRPRLFPYLPDQKFTKKKIQTVPVPIEKSYRRVMIDDVSIYHLENVDPRSRAERAIVYEALSPGSRKKAARSSYWRKHDPTGKYIRKYGYAYLADSRGAVLEPVPPGVIYPPPTQPYIFRVPDRLLLKESGRSRRWWSRWLLRTLAS